MKNRARLVRVSLSTTLLAALMTATPALAGPIIYDNGNPDLTIGFVSDPVCATTVCPAGAQFMADDFMFAQDTLVADVTVYGVYANTDTLMEGDPSSNDVTVRFFADDGTGLPDSTPPLAAFAFGGAVTPVDTGTDIGPAGTSASVYSITVDFTPTLFLAATTYWVSVINDTTGAWIWLTSGVAGSQGFGAAFSMNDTGWGRASFDGVERELAFQLSGPTPVPEPGALSLLGLGLAGLGLTRRRKTA